MEMLPNLQEKTCRVVDFVRKREIQESITHTISKKLHVTDSLISRLGLETELNGHTGCVNCLEWNESGTILASASDDNNIILWDPFRYKKKVVLETGHHGNIFSVKFMPKSSDRVLVSGAGDCRVRMHDLSLTEPTLACYCHTRRVKRIATSLSIPFMFWTAAEDGFVLQYDIRTPHTCKSEDSNNVLINLVHHLGARAEGKCISINPKKPELIAIGANDEYIRMYDRRMIKLSKMPVTFSPPIELTAGTMALFRPGEGDPDNNIPLDGAQYFVAGHLRSQQRDGNRTLTTTYLTFSADGNELLVNMGGEQIYLFDINDPRHRKTFYGRSSKKCTESTEKDEVGKCCTGKNDESGDDFTDLNVKTLPPFVEELERQANINFEDRKYAKAINLYNKAINLCPRAAVLFANRAAAYMKRAWDGDTYAALRDCQTTLLLDPMNVKAHYRLARCLLDLNRAAEAEKVIKAFQRKHPVYASHPTCKALKIDIRRVIDSGKDSQTNQYHLSEYERAWRRNTIDYKIRFCGHCNTTTDIKEANFFGNGQYIAAGSDDGSFFIWDRNTTNILRVLDGDYRIVNCLQPHPSTCLLATSGIEPVIRLWSPLPEDGTVNKREIANLDDAAAANQIRMNRDPFEVMLMNMGYSLPLLEATFDDDIEELGGPLIATANPLDCRPS